MKEVFAFVGLSLIAVSIVDLLKEDDKRKHEPKVLTKSPKGDFHELKFNPENGLWEMT